jgi:hypothetical protein
MKGPHPLKVELRRSRLVAALVLVSHLATATLLAFAPGDAMLRAAAVAAIGAHALRAVRTWALQSAARAVVGVELTADRRAVLIERCGRRCEGEVRAESYVGERLTTLVVRPNGARVSRAIPILPDMLPEEDLRRLRVLLRYGDASTTT